MQATLRLTAAALFTAFALSLQAQDQPASPAPAKPETLAQRQQEAWKMLSDAVLEDKRPEVRTQALSALSDLGQSARANRLIAQAMKDPDLDVRSAALVAAGHAKASRLLPNAHKLLDDPEPQVVYTAAVILWRDFHDHSGEDILDAIVSGDRKTKPTLIHGAEHQMSSTMHSPATMAKLGVTQGAGMLLGPFGFSIMAIEYIRKSGTDTSRSIALELLAEAHTPASRDYLMDALSDKDQGVRATGARFLGKTHDRRYATALAPLLEDDKQPVRFSAAAAYINCTQQLP
ncbi:MAG: HEAT repeat domain-containing protein [Acidobacteriaceae bacterium]|nr:HEAT repeat domain-containing protein [Acidobacteriaceae bacterium]